MSQVDKYRRPSRWISTAWYSRDKVWLVGMKPTLGGRNWFFLFPSECFDSVMWLTLTHVSQSSILCDTEVLPNSFLQKAGTFSQFFNTLSFNRSSVSIENISVKIFGFPVSNSSLPNTVPYSWSMPDTCNFSIRVVWIFRMGALWRFSNEGICSSA